MGVCWEGNDGVGCRSKVGLKLDNSQCTGQCFTSDTAAEFISQSLRKGQYKPVVPVASVQGMIMFLCMHQSLSRSDGRNRHPFNGLFSRTAWICGHQKV